MLYRLDCDAAQLAERFGAVAGADPWSGGHVSPGRFAPVITAGREFVAGPRGERQPRRVIPRLWGVPPPRSAFDQARGIASVRNPDSPFWIGNLRNSEFRCLVPASACMEWGRASASTGKRRQLWIGASDQDIFAFAGVWTDSEVPSFALLTCEAGAALRAEGLERMPVILPRDPATHEAWLRADWDRAKRLIAPYASSLLSVSAAG